MTNTSAELFDRHRSFLWGLLYRMTGCAADADDLVQETFVRLLENAPRDDGRPLRPWLVRVGMNLAHDLLRRRRRTPYVGPWLPSPVTADAEAERLDAVEAVASGVSTEGRYDLVESMSMAFLVALEALTPRQRAVLLLRDVFDYTVRETAAVLGAGEGATKVAHLRARRAMAAYDGCRHPSLADAREQALAALGSFAGALLSGDLARMEELLTQDCVALSDGGGEFYAARNPVRGAAGVARLFLGLFTKFGGLGEAAMVEVGGMPALLVRVPNRGDGRGDLETTRGGFDPARQGFDPARQGFDPARVATRFLLQADVDGQGRVTRLYSVLASRKLTHVTPAVLSSVPA